MADRRAAREADYLTGVAHWDEAWDVERDSLGAVGPVEPFIASLLGLAMGRVAEPPSRIVELGAGGGTCLAWLRRIFPAAHAIGLDYSSVGLKLAAGRLAPGDAAGRLVAARFESPPFRPGSFDLVTSFGLIEHFTGDARLACLRAHVALVRPGGLIAITAPNRASPVYRGWYGLADAIQRFSLPLARRLGVNVVPEYALTARELAEVAREVGLARAEIYSSRAAVDLWSIAARRFGRRELPAWLRRHGVHPVTRGIRLGSALGLVGTAG